MAERGGRDYAVRTGHEVHSTQALQELKIEQREQEIAVLKQRNADLLACLDEAVAYIHRLKPKVSARIVAEIAQLKRETKCQQLSRDNSSVRLMRCTSTELGYVI